MLLSQLKRGLWRTIELVLLVLIVYAHWYPDPVRISSLILFIPLFAGRFLIYRRLITRTPLDLWMVGFLALCCLNVIVAPYTWGWYVVSRAAMGVGVVWVIGDWSHDPRTARRLFPALLVIGLILALTALFTSQYTIKSEAFIGIIDHLPVIRNNPALNDLPPFNGSLNEIPARVVTVIMAAAGSIIGGGFNVNEIGGIMALVAPAAAAFAITRITPLRRSTRILAWASLALLTIAILLGQSRMAVMGVIAMTSLLIFAVIPRGVYRSVALVILTAFFLLEIGVLSGIFVPANLADERLERDESSLQTRLYIWESAVHILADHPLTGVGINQFRARPVRDLYPVTDYTAPNLPHAHNLLLQTGSDLGLPGILLYIGWTASLGLMLRHVWRQGTGWERTAAAAVAAGIASHLVFSLADAITLFDRFIFLYWVVVGGGAALYNYTGSTSPNTGKQQIDADTSTSIDLKTSPLI